MHGGNSKDIPSATPQASLPSSILTASTRPFSCDTTSSILLFANLARRLFRCVSAIQASLWTCCEALVRSTVSSMRGRISTRWLRTSSRVRGGTSGGAVGVSGCGRRELVIASGSSSEFRGWSGRDGCIECDCSPLCSGCKGMSGELEDDIAALAAFVDCVDFCGGDTGLQCLRTCLGAAGDACTRILHVDPAIVRRAKLCLMIRHRWGCRQSLLISGPKDLVASMWQLVRSRARHFASLCPTESGASKAAEARKPRTAGPETLQVGELLFNSICLHIGTHCGR